MKYLIITFLALALCIQARAGGDILATTDGVLYKGITLERVEPDGIYIEYSTPGGGMGMSKVKFERLSRAVQRQFGYSQTAARDYEAQVAQANEDAAKELTQRYEIQQNVRHQRDVENQQAYAGRMAEITRINAAQAAAFYRSTKADPYSNRTLEISPQFTNGRISSETSFTPIPQEIFPNRGTIIKSH